MLASPVTPEGKLSRQKFRQLRLRPAASCHRLALSTGELEEELEPRWRGLGEADCGCWWEPSWSRGRPPSRRRPGSRPFLWVSWSLFRDKEPSRRPLLSVAVVDHRTRWLTCWYASERQWLHSCSSLYRRGMGGGVYLMILVSLSCNYTFWCIQISKFDARFYVNLTMCFVNMRLTEHICIANNQILLIESNF